MPNASSPALCDALGLPKIHISFGLGFQRTLKERPATPATGTNRLRRTNAGPLDGSRCVGWGRIGLRSSIAMCADNLIWGHSRNISRCDNEVDHRSYPSRCTRCKLL
jgi:hypothetical protein